MGITDRMQGMQYREIPLFRLRFSSKPVRIHRSRKAIDRLKESIKAGGGIIDPLLVQKTGTEKYEVIAGETRLTALNELYSKSYVAPCLVTQISDRESSVELALVENAVREGMSPYEHALAAKDLVENQKYRRTKVAQILGRPRQYVTHLLEVFALIQEVQQALHDGGITMGHARTLFMLRESPVLQKKLLEQILACELTIKMSRVLGKQLLGHDGQWFMKPGTENISDTARLVLLPCKTGFELHARFANKDELEQVLQIVRNRVK